MVETNGTPVIMGDSGFGGGAGFWGFLILAMFLFGGSGFGGFGGNAGNANAIQADVNRGFDNQNLQAQTRDILSAVTSGTAQGVSATNQTFHDTLMAMNDKYSELQRDIAGVAMAEQESIAKQLECCNNTLRAIDGVNYNNAMTTASINANTTAQTQKILDAITGNRMADMQNQINQLQLQNAMSNVVRYPNSWAYNAGTSPFCNCNNGCGCMA